MGPACRSGGHGHPWSHPPEAPALYHSAQPSKAGASALSPNSLWCPHFPTFPLVLLHTPGQKGQGDRTTKPRRAGASVQLSRVQIFTTLWAAARQASLSITNSWSLLKLMPIESGMPFNHLILCRPLLLLPSVFPSIREKHHPFQ